MGSDDGAQSAPTRGGSFDEGLVNGQRLLAQHPEVALQQAQTLLRSGPEPRALQLEAAALRQLRRQGEAERAELAAITASFGLQELDDAAVAGQEGRTADSRIIIERFLDRQPGNLLALTMAAELDIDDWRLERAEQRLRTVVERAPSYLRAIMLLGKCLSSQARVQEALVIVQNVLRRKPDNLIALRTLAQLSAEENDHERSADTYRRILDLEPANLDVWIVYAQELRMLGRQDESKAAFREAISLDPSSGAAWWGLVNFFASEVTDADIAAMQLALDAPKGSPHHNGSLHIALAILAERRGDFAEAFGRVEQGKKLRALAHPYDSAGASAGVDEQIRTFTPELFAAFAGAGSSADSPIFIIGMPRSGTTLLERILSRHSKVEACGELPIMPRLEERSRRNTDGDGSYSGWISSITADQLTDLGKEYVDRSLGYRKSDKPRFIDKLNHNWSRVGLIRLMLPNARIIDLRRDALDCCWSNFKMMFAEGHNAANDQREIARFYRDYVRLVGAVDAASTGGILAVRYEQLVDDVEGETRRILEFLGLGYEPTCIDFHLSAGAVATPSSEQVRRPLNRDSIGSADPYRPWLGPMIEELGELAR